MFFVRFLICLLISWPLSISCNKIGNVATFSKKLSRAFQCPKDSNGKCTANIMGFVAVKAQFEQANGDQAKDTNNDELVTENSFISEAPSRIAREVAPLPGTAGPNSPDSEIPASADDNDVGTTSQTENEQVGSTISQFTDTPSVLTSSFQGDQENIHQSSGEHEQTTGGHTQSYASNQGHTEEPEQTTGGHTQSYTSNQGHTEEPEQAILKDSTDSNDIKASSQSASMLLDEDEQNDNNIRLTIYDIELLKKKLHKDLDYSNLKNVRCSTENQIHKAIVDLKKGLLKLSYNYINDIKSVYDNTTVITKDALALIHNSHGKIPSNKQCVKSRVINDGQQLLLQGIATKTTEYYKTVVDILHVVSAHPQYFRFRKMRHHPNCQAIVEKCSVQGSRVKKVVYRIIAFFAALAEIDTQ